MWTLLRSTVASPRKPFYDEKTQKQLDLAYITPRIIVCSMPTTDVVRRKYRIPAMDLRDFLDLRHKDHWRIWNFRAEKSGGYKDEVFYGRVMHFPFPDHEAPPFRLIPKILSSIDMFLQDSAENVAVLHCKAGQGRSGTIACAYMITYMGMTWQQAIDRFTAKRMRFGFGAGVSIKSQKRYLKYTELWAKQLNRSYVGRDKSVVIQRILVANPRYDDIVIKCSDYASYDSEIRVQQTFTAGDYSSEFINDTKYFVYGSGGGIRVNPDVLLSFTRAKTLLGGFNVIHAVAHFWFNAILEVVQQVIETEADEKTKSDKDDPRDSHENPQKGVLKMAWEELDGVIGTSSRGTKIFDSIAVMWSLDSDVGSRALESINQKSQESVNGNVNLGGNLDIQEDSRAHEYVNGSLKSNVSGPLAGVDQNADRDRNDDVEVTSSHTSPNQQNKRQTINPT